MSAVVSFAPNAILLPSSPCFTNHKSLLPPFNNLPNQKIKPCFRIFSSSSTQSQRRTTATATSSTRKPVAVYLMETFGFSEEQSLSISEKFLNHRRTAAGKHVQVTDLISIEKADDVITFLQELEHCGFDQSRIKKLVTKCPQVLAAKVDKTLKPKITLLQEVGFTSSDLAHIFIANPALYLQGDLSPAIQALRGIMGSDEGVVRVFKRLSWGSAANITNNLIPNATMLENEYGIPRHKIQKFLCGSPVLLASNNETSLRDVLVKIEDKWGISRDSTEFLRALLIFCGMSDENINSKCQVFRSYGWSNSDIISLIRKCPICFTSSEARFKKSLEFYMNELGYDPAYMASRPALFTYSLENRVVPRHKALVILKEKELIKADYQLISAIKLTEDGFLNRFIFPYENIVLNLREVFVDVRASGDGKTSEDETDQK